MRKIHEAFTIIELLIVIVVIGILAAISMVAYSGIQRQAAETGLRVDLAQAARQLGLSQAENDEYPGEDNVVTDGLDIDLQPSADNTFQYTRTGEGAGYCLTATSSRDGVPSFMVSSDNTTPRVAVPGAICPGHIIAAEDGEGASIEWVSGNSGGEWAAWGAGVSGVGFMANEQVEVTLKSGYVGETYRTTTTVQASPDGTLSYTYHRSCGGLYFIEARGLSSGRFASTPDARELGGPC